MKEKLKLERYLRKYLFPREAFIGVIHSVKKAKVPEEMEMECCGARSDISNYIEKEKEEETFQTKLFELIDQRELKDSDVYNKVNLDRRLFSKIRSNKDYHPSKETVILLGLSLECSEEEIEELLRSASYSLPKNTTYDLIIRFCFKEHIYNLNKINEFLYEHNCKLLNNES